MKTATKALLLLVLIGLVSVVAGVIAGTLCGVAAAAPVTLVVYVVLTLSRM